MQPPTLRSRADTRRAHRLQRNEAVRLRFSERYEQQRERFDDVVAALAVEFFVTPRTIHRILTAPDIQDETLTDGPSQLSDIAADPYLAPLE